MFQQDKAPSHKAENSLWMINEIIQIPSLDWPPNSPDLNIIEHVWAELKRRLSNYDTPPNDIKELWERAQHEWNNISVEFIKKLYDSMQRRIDAVIQANGGNTRY